MRIVCPFSSPYFANTYILGEEGEAAIVIDPGNNENGCLDRYLEKHHQGHVAAILLTHGHYDHIYGLLSLKHRAPIYLHPLDERYLRDDRYNLLRGLKIEGYPIRLVEDHEIIDINGISFRVIHTPFHTPGSVCYYCEAEQALFSGDTLFHLSIGRSDLPGGESRKIPSSLAKLKALPDEVKVYPGHEGSSTLSEEKRLNPYFNL